MSASEHIKELTIDSTLWTDPKELLIYTILIQKY